MTNSEYWVYILHCSNNSYYTGYTTNIVRRYHAHLNGDSKCKYTQSFKPIKLAQCWYVNGDKALAMKIERYIKKFTRNDKIQLILNPKQLSLIFPVQPVCVEI